MMPAYIKPELIPMPTPRTVSQTPSNSNVTYPGGYGVQPTDQAAPSQKPIVNPFTGRPKSPEPEPDPTGIDSTSAKKHFGWVTIDKVNVPVLFRNGDKYTSVRIVEDKFLKHYPSTFSDELGSQSPLISYYVTLVEAKLLNEINVYHCDSQYGKKTFDGSELLVKVSEFTEFLLLVKKTFPEEVIEARKLGIPLPVPSELRNSECGWIQVNNTISPYIRRDGKKYVISNVMRHAAQLPLTSQHDEYLPTDTECTRINRLCQSAGFDFQFGQSTKFISLDKMRAEHNLKVVELPQDNPRDYAKYTEGNHANSTVTPQAPRTSVFQPAPRPVEPSKLKQLEQTRSNIRPPYSQTITRPTVPQVRPQITPPARQIHTAQARHPYSATDLQYSSLRSAMNPNVPNSNNLPNQMSPHSYLTQQQQQTMRQPNNTQIPNASSYSSYYNNYNHSTTSTQKKSTYPVSLPVTPRTVVNPSLSSNIPAHVSNQQVRTKQSVHDPQISNKHVRQMAEMYPTVSSNNPARMAQGIANHSHPSMSRATAINNAPAVVNNPPRNTYPATTQQQPMFSPFFPTAQYPMVLPSSLPSVPSRNNDMNIQTNANAMNMWYLNGNANGVPAGPLPYSPVNSNPAINGYPQHQPLSAGASFNSTSPSASLNRQRSPPSANDRNKITSPTYQNVNRNLNNYVNKNPEPYPRIGIINQASLVSPQNTNSIGPQTVVPSTSHIPPQKSLPALIPDYSVQTKNTLTKDYNNFVANDPIPQSAVNVPPKVSTQIYMPPVESPTTRSSKSTEALSPNTIQQQVLSTHAAENELTPPTLVPETTSVPVASSVNETPQNIITSHTFEGKGISCVEHTPNEQYALLEAVQKLYFKDTQLDEFEFVIQQVLEISTHPCTVAEERAFVLYYELPTQVLNSSKLIKLTDLSANFKRLTYMFKNQDDRSSVSSACATPPTPPPEDDDNPPAQSTKLVDLSENEDEVQPRPAKRKRIDDDADVIIIE